jgi:hydroxypyruvate isomerase
LKLDLPVNGMNVRMGETFGCAAISKDSKKYEHDLNDAVKIAMKLKIPTIHVMSGITTADDAGKTLISSLEYALENSTQIILIEPVCNEQLPGYFLRTIEQAAEIIRIINHPRLKILFDCYHVYKESENLMDAFAKNVESIGHVQISAAENRAEPVPGHFDYSTILPQMETLGYNGAFGCEYRPSAKTEDGLTWRNDFRRDAK